MIDQGSAAVIGAVLVLAGTIVSTRSASRKGKQEAEHAKQAEQEQTQAAQSVPFAENLALTTYIRQQVREGVQAETESLRRELGEVKRVLGNVYGRLDRMREAIREYIRQVREQWNKNAEPPPVVGHLADLLNELDEDTWTAAKIAELTAAPQIDAQPPDNYGN